MIQIEFTEQDIEQLHHEHVHHPDPRVRQRMATVYLKALGYSHQEIGRIVRISQKTLRRTLRQYQSGGIEALKQVNRYRPTSELEQYRTAIEAEFTAKPPQTINEATERIAQLTGVRRSPSQVRQFLRRLGMKRLKVGQIPAKADAAEQKAFLEGELKPRLTEAQQGKRHVFFVDAAHFVLHPFLGFLWCFARVFIPAPSGRQRLNVLGALHATSRQLVTIVNDTYVNAETVAALLRQIAANYATLPITLVLDNVRYQHCQPILALAAQLGIELLFLPPYSPNLNLIERLWRFVKQECLYSRYYATFAEFKQAIVDCLAKTQTEHQQKLASLLTLKFQVLGNVTL